MSDGFEIMSLIADAITIASPVYKVCKSIILALSAKKGTNDEALKNVKLGDLSNTLFKSGKISCYQYCELKNFEMIAVKADEYYSKMEGGSESIEYEWDWITRFYEAAKDVSDEMLQDLWARILAGEIDGQAGYSFRTIDVLKNMGREDALLFGRVAKCMIHVGVRVFLPDNEEYLKQNGLTYEDVMNLNEMGLMHEISANLNLDYKEKNQQLFRNKEFMVLITTDNSDVIIDHIPIRNYALTKVGEDLIFLQEACDLSDENLMLFAGIFNASQTGLRAEVHKINQDGSGDDYISIYTKDLLTGEETLSADNMSFDCSRETTRDSI